MAYRSTVKSLENSASSLALRKNFLQLIILRQTAKLKPLIRVSSTTWRWSLKSTRGFRLTSSLKCYGHTKRPLGLPLGKLLSHWPTKSKLWSLWKLVYLLFSMRPTIKKRITLFNPTSLIYSRRNMTSQTLEPLHTKGSLKGTPTPRLKKESSKKATWF